MPNVDVTLQLNQNSSRVGHIAHALCRVGSIMDHTTAIIKDRSTDVAPSNIINTTVAWPETTLATVLTPPVIEALQEVIELSPRESTTEFSNPHVALDLRQELESPVRDIHHAFARFLMIDVASGDATADTIKAYHREVKLFTQWCLADGIEPVQAKRHHIEAYREALKANGIAVATRSHKLSIVRRFYEAAALLIRPVERQSPRVMRVPATGAR